MSLLGTLNPNLTQAEQSVSVAREIHHHEVAGSVSTEETMMGEEDKVEIANEEQIEEEVTRLAQKLTRQSTRFSVTEGQNTFIDTPDEDSTLNPASANFRARNWMKNLLAITSRDPERYPARQAGCAWFW
ncbi:CDR ABC transporter [Penicillium malachiteum]|nr:CDR ABC transporter [Penicillium malachiteum]